MRFFSPLTSSVRRRWTRLETRERRALSLLVLVLCILLAWLGIWQPLQEARRHAEAQYHSKHADLDWMRAHANDIHATPTTRAETRPLLSIASELAGAFQLSLSQAEPLADGSVRISLTNSSFNRLVLWLEALQRTHGITASQLTITRKTEPGMVDATLTLAPRT